MTKPYGQAEIVAENLIFLTGRQMDNKGFYARYITFLMILTIMLSQGIQA